MSSQSAPPKIIGRHRSLRRPVRPLPALLLLALVPLLGTCAPRPPKTIRLPPVLNEASGLAIRDNAFYWHNDSGDGPLLYATGPDGGLFRSVYLPVAARDWEDLTTDPQGRFYLADTGNNRGQRTQQTIYRYDDRHKHTDSIVFVYPQQDGGGRHQPGNYDCEAVVYHRDTLHFFTKDQLWNAGRDLAYHFTVPAAPGRYVAELRDSLRLPGRVITAAALDSVRGELVLTAYTFRRSLGFLPNGAASLVTITDFPAGRFLRGRVRRCNLSWFWPTQFEAVDFYDDRWLYVASEATPVRRRAVAKRKKRRRYRHKRLPRR